MGHLFALSAHSLHITMCPHGSNLTSAGFSQSAQSSSCAAPSAVYNTNKTHVLTLDRWLAYSDCKIQRPCSLGTGLEAAPFFLILISSTLASLYGWVLVVVAVSTGGLCPSMLLASCWGVVCCNVSLSSCGCLKVSLFLVFSSFDVPPAGGCPAWSTTSLLSGSGIDRVLCR